MVVANQLYHSKLSSLALPHAGEAEFRELTPAEAQLLRQACEPVQGSSSSSSSGAAAHPVSGFDGALLQGLYKRGLIFLEVPVAADDRISLPPLEVRRTRTLDGAC
jgi:hypothetical protein